jgi:hypothetical protein
VIKYFNFCSLHPLNDTGHCYHDRKGAEILRTAFEKLGWNPAPDLSTFDKPLLIIQDNSTSLKREPSQKANKIFKNSKLAIDTACNMACWTIGLPTFQKLKILSRGPNNF